VSEADVGALKDGLPARFVVDAYPDREFHATMRQFRLAANVVQNVVTYNVVLDVDNKDEMLKPGMTAQVRLVVANRPNVLRIPTTALRFQLPEEEQEKLRKQEQEKAGKDGKVKQVAQKPAAPNQDDDLAFRTANETARQYKVYRLDAKNQPQPVDIRVGLSNFRYTEVVSGGLKTGDQVVTRTLAQPKEDM
jgi:HlyD family secretion protein